MPKTNHTANDTKLYCLPQKNENETCANEAECGNNMGCLNGKCTYYLSLQDGTNVTDGTKSTYSFCASGLLDNLSNKCVSSSRVGDKYTECNNQTECIYLDTDGREVTSLTKCKCALGNTGKSYCELGTSKFITNL